MSKQSTSYDAIKHTKTTFHFKLPPLVASFWCEESSLVSGFLGDTAGAACATGSGGGVGRHRAGARCLARSSLVNLRKLPMILKGGTNSETFGKALYWELLGVGGVYSVIMMVSSSGDVPKLVSWWGKCYTLPMFHVYISLFRPMHLKQWGGWNILGFGLVDPPLTTLDSSWCFFKWKWKEVSESANQHFYLDVFGVRYFKQILILYKGHHCGRQSLRSLLTVEK